MKASEIVRYARQHAGLSQRDLASRAGMAQPAIARIETGRVDPGVATVARLLRACRMELVLGPRLGEGVDRTAIIELLRLSPRRRLERAVIEARNLEAAGW